MDETPPDLIVTDLHRRTTGVSATIRTLLPHIARRMKLALVSKRDAEYATSVGLRDALKISRTPPAEHPVRIWHARRNNEMLWGLILKHIFRCRLKLVMTSCALRRHSWFPRLLLSRMDEIIATSDQAASYFPRVAAIVPHGVDCERFQPATEPKSKILKQFGLPEDRGIVICGRIRPEKGTDLFVKALVETLPKHPGFFGCIVGRAAPEHQAFQQQLKSLIAEAGLEDRFHWMGEVEYDRMPALMSGMSLCVASARYEGFGLVPLEAMACGVPVVASRTGCYTDAIEPGTTGELFDCDDLPGLTAALDTMLQKPEGLDQLASACRERAEQHYSAELEADRIIQVYEKVWQNAA